MKIGVLGVGALTEALIRGVQRSSTPFEWCVSPRSAERVASLQDLAGVTVATDNQAVVDHCQTLVIGVRPEQLDDLMASVKLTAAHHLISLVAGVKTSDLAHRCHPAQVTRMMASIAVAYPGASVFLYPQNNALSTLFKGAGYGVQSFATEDQFEASMLSVCVNAWWLEQIQALAETLVAKTGMALPEAVALLARAQQESAVLLQQRPDSTPAALAREIGTPGTFTARGLKHLKANQAEQPWVEILSQLLAELKRP
ncbi:pyrroline-5-carboxylate reductase family protein [Nitrincola sp.]|uniref:pyrroline-5-carboxylate reductase family protein n=1 Tax=Nitrincola sp. TaxID=1926584 RepID=UPI003A909CA6